MPGLGPAAARRIEAFFAAQPALTERARPDRNCQYGRRCSVGIAAAAARGRWLVGRLSCAAAHLHARCRQRLRSRSGMAVAARIRCPSHAFTGGEWMLVRTIADGFGWSYGWEAPAAQRRRFVLDFA